MTGELMRDPNLQGLWHLNGNLNDSSVNGYNLTASTSAPTDVVGKFGQGKLFVRASSQYAAIADASCPNLEITGSRTYVCWLKANALANSFLVMGKVNAAGTASSRIQVNAAGTPTFFINGLTTNEYVNGPTGSVVSGVWSCLIGVYDSTAEKIKMYVNGLLTELPASGSSTDTNTDFAIGGDIDSPATWGVDGVIDEVAVYNRAWSHGEVLKYLAWAKGRMTKLI